LTERAGGLIFLARPQEQENGDDEEECGQGEECQLVTIEFHAAS
jgi:hypothetical protein